MSSPTDHPETEKILRHLAEIGAERCTITDATIEAEPDPDMRQILVGLLVLSEDLAFARRLREEADAARAAAATERERLLEERRLAVCARDQFLAIASHELRTPLTTMTLQVESFDRAVRNGPEVAVAPLLKRLGVLRRQVDRLTSLVLEMLDVSRITTGRLELRPEEVELGELIREVVERFDVEIERRHVDVKVSAEAPVRGSWDRGRLDQVVSNLLSNALKYGRDGPVEIVVAGRGDRARVEVHDHGIGIAPDDQEKIFAPFARAVSAQHYGGLGLGLWISRQIVEACGGTISVRSPPDAGSTFIVELPGGG